MVGEGGGFWGFNQGKKPGLQGGTLHKVYYRVLVIVFTQDFKDRFIGHKSALFPGQ
jgi:hypothetical protein